MNIRKRRSDRSGRVRLFSPGRPPVAGREERRRFWAAIAAGTGGGEGAGGGGVPQAVGTRWFRKAGGHAAIDVWAIGEAALWSVSLVCGAGGDRAPSRSGLLHAGGRSPARASGIDNLQSCGATPPPEAAASRIVRRQRNGTPSALLAAQSRRSLRATR